MNNHRYILEPYKGMSSRYRCPECGKGKTFSRYIDTETGNHIADNVGRCERIDNCGYHYTPKQYFQDHNISFDKPQQRQFKPTVKPAPKPVSFIPVEIFKQSLRDYDKNNFVKFLIALFGNEIAGKLVSKYFIGTSKHWQYGTTAFWYIDLKGNINYGKLMFYNIIESTRSIIGKDCKRDKNRNNHCASVLQKQLNEADKPLPEWLVKYENNERKINCFFGEHLLRDNTKPVAIVESEKTAIIASVYLPEFVWLACGSKNGLNADKCKVLTGRNVTLFPDLNGFEAWRDKAKELFQITRFTVSDLLECKASETEKEKGLDLADYLIKLDHKGNSLHSLCSLDILNTSTETRLTKEFHFASWRYVQTTKGNFDLLFSNDGELLQPKNEQVVININSFFNKQFLPVLIENTTVFIHTYN